MAPVQIADGVYWVGAADWDLRDFHTYTTLRGTSYNAYLIVDEKVALIDTVKAPFYDEMLARIREVVDPARIDFLVANHAELDHSGALPLIKRDAPNARVLVSPRFGELHFRRHFYPDWPMEPVAENVDLDLGRRHLRFFTLPMLHWPETMATYLVEDGILFSNDAFGQHFASSKVFDDEVDLPAVMAEARRYYATILMPLSDLVARALTRLSTLPINVICPSHGIIWRSHKDAILGAYGRWSRGDTEAKVCVVYETMWGSTEAIARAIAGGVADEGVDVNLHHLGFASRAEAIGDLLEARALLVGSPTMNNGVLPSVAGFLHNLKGLKPKSKLGAAFGSHGWSGNPLKLIEDELRAAGVEVIESELNFRFVPDADELAKCVAFGRELARRVKGD